MSDSSTEDLADIYQALGNQTRLEVLLKLSEDGPVSDIHKEKDISRSGLQKHIERLIKSELVYRPREKKKTYELTPLGNHFVELLETDGEAAVEVLELFRDEKQRLEEKNSEAKETLEEAGVDLTDFQQKIEEEAWQNIWEDAEDEL